MQVLSENIIEILISIIFFEKMTLNLEIRKLIRSHLESGKKTPEIFKQLNKTIPKRTIYWWVKRLSKREIEKSIEITER